MTSLLTDSVLDGEALQAQAGPVKAAPGSALSPNLWAWIFVVASVAGLWVLGGNLRSLGKG